MVGTSGSCRLLEIPSTLNFIAHPGLITAPSMASPISPCSNRVPQNMQKWRLPSAEPRLQATTISAEQQTVQHAQRLDPAADQNSPQALNSKGSTSLLRVSPCESHYELVAESLSVCGSVWLCGPSELGLTLQAGTGEFSGKVDVSLQETRQLDLGKHCPIASHLPLKTFSPAPHFTGPVGSSVVSWSGRSPPGAG